ncbi:MAG: stage V sporulation protein AC [Clostridia bacterium]|nr:stage V sporulation protein AC [Clostridia bacterium]
MKISNSEYKKLAESTARRSPVFKNCVAAFLVGGTICTLGQGLKNLYEYLKLPDDSVKTLVPVSLIFIAVLLTGLGIFDKIAKFAGAGTLVPITGFANAVASPAIDTKAEGFILGVGAKMFTIAGPVIVYGTVASVVYGLIYCVTKLF